ncbi:helix-turn-helix domain-containing protein [Microbacterium mangrovi]|uniref:helix-turn-helix domain-containing protein n=1 Tax=Microbacterium mangrovi TaxID=1348253 RepID=UPI0038B3AAB8
MGRMGRRLLSDNDAILSPAQVAALIGRHVETVTLALRNGELKGSQREVGGYWYIRREDAIAWALGGAASN